MSSAGNPTVPNRRGGLVVISGPSGAGKSTVVRKLLVNCPLPLVLSVSATTRQPRQGEVDGVDYHFLSREEFQQRREAGQFLECKEVFGGGHWYGTLQSEVTAGLNANKWLILEIDVQGAMSVLETHPKTVTIFVHSGSLEELERRLRQRGTESEAQLQRRLEVARQELTYLDRYQYSIINNDVSQAAREICEILARHGAHA
ncbi:MAG TPA: guanylate kinase [Pirellulaceae bacterium]|nr:guanylate kinase [Pirellulaceae bacterium]